MLNECRFSSREALIARLAGVIASKLREALDEKGEASLVLSGGSTPLPLFQALSKMRLDWANVWVTLADERWVSPEHEASNEALVREHLLNECAAQAKFVSLWNDAPTPEAGLELTRKVLAEIPQPFDVVVLGMGDDGHTASLFPDAKELGAALEAPADVVCLPVTPPVAPHLRMTLTKAALLNSDEVFLHIVGEGKHSVLEDAKSSRDVEEMPIRAFLHQSETPVSVFWAP